MIKNLYRVDHMVKDVWRYSEVKVKQDTNQSGRWVWGGSERDNYS